MIYQYIKKSLALIMMEKIIEKYSIFHLPILVFILNLSFIICLIQGYIYMMYINSNNIIYTGMIINFTALEQFYITIGLLYWSQLQNLGGSRKG